MPIKKQSTFGAWWQSTGAAMKPYSDETQAAFIKRACQVAHNSATYTAVLRRATRGLNDDNKKVVKL